MNRQLEHVGVDSSRCLLKYIKLYLILLKINKLYKIN
jgi:hypothetical protein